jgi:hypothetical protein
MIKHLAVTQNRKPALAPDRDSSTGPQSHSAFTAERSKNYHKAVIGTEVRHSAMKMTKAEHTPQSNEDMDEKGHRL